MIDVEMEYRPTSRSAIMRAGGRVIAQDYRGHAEYRENTGVALYLQIQRETEARGIAGDTQFEILG